MDLVFFVYTVSLIGLALVTCSVSVVVWLMTSRKDSAVAAMGFALYAADLALIFFDEYTRIKNDYAVTFQEALTHPALSLLLGFCILLCMWVWMLLRTHAKVSAASVLEFAVPVGVFMSLLVPRDDSSDVIQQYLYWIVRDLAMVACLMRAVHRYRTAESDAVRLDLGRSRTFAAVASVLLCCVLIEDTAMILFVRPPADNVLIGTFFWHLQERNLSENALMVVAAIWLIGRYREVLVVYSRHPGTEGFEQGDICIDQGDMESRLALFCEQRSLSPREREVMRLVVRGLDARNIASELVVSLGTVKAHLHRIYMKAGVGTRDALLEVFWKQ